MNLNLIIYECIFDIEIDNKIYKFGDLITDEEYFNLSSDQRRFFELKDKYTTKVINKDKEGILWDSEGYITRDIGFELQFGFSDKIDEPAYKESYGLEERSIPNNINLIDDL